MRGLICWLTVTLSMAWSTVGLHADIERIWLSHAFSDTSRVTVSWEISTPADSALEWGPTESLGQTRRIASAAVRHAVEIAPPASGPWHYRVRSGTHISSVIRVPGADAEVFRAAVIADVAFGSKQWLSAVLHLRPALLLAAGDIVPALASSEAASTTPDDMSAFRRLIDAAPEVFRAIPFMAALGNHDRQLCPRGSSPPERPVYDCEARAFREFFAFPGEEWRWTLDVRGFGVRFVAVDLSHTSDAGSTWQTCHDFGPGSDQLDWYRRVMHESRQTHVITLYNEQHRAVRRLAGGAWWSAIRRGSAAVTGFGHFAERSEPDGLPCFNISVNGKGARYPDPESRFLQSEDSLLLLIFPRRGPARAEIISLGGAVLDARELLP